MKKYPLQFFTLYFFLFMLNALYSTFFPIYFKGLGMPSGQIGILLAIGPLVAIFAQPFWGIVSDKAKYKNISVLIMLGFSAILVLLFPLSKSFIYLAAVLTLFMFFRTSAPIVTNAVTLEYLNERKLEFGPVRIAGSVGYSLIAVAAGIISKGDNSKIFSIYAVVAGIAFLNMILIPKIEGHRTEDKKQPVTVLFKYKRLMIMVLFAFVIQITMGYYYGFAYIHIKSLGGDNSLIGIATMIASISGIPFLWFAKKIIDRMGPEKTLLAGGVVTGLRWLLFATVNSPWVLVLFQVLHGFTFIVFSYTLAVYISQNVPAELKATGQTLNALLVFGISKILGSSIGGFLDARYGGSKVFLINLGVVAVACVIYAITFAFKKKTKFIEL